MFSTDSRTQDPRTHDPHTHDSPAQAPPEQAPRSLPDTRAWLREPIDGRVALGVGIAWFVLTQVAFALEPATQRPVPLVGVVLELGMYALLFTMVAGLALRRRWGLLASLAGALLATAAAIACPLSGHHHFGAWWFGEMACVFTLVGISMVTLRRDYS
jgi:hypothetical protein